MELALSGLSASMTPFPCVPAGSFITIGNVIFLMIFFPASAVEAM